MKSPSSSLLKNRIEKFKAYLRAKQLEACLIDAPVDLLYLTGLHLSRGTLLAFPDEAHLFVDGRYIQMAEERSPVPAHLLSDQELARHLARKKAKKIAFDSQTTPFAQYEKLKTALSPVLLQPIDSPTRSLRLIKDAHEIAALKKSAKLLWKGFEHLKKKVKAGITEEALAIEFEIFCRKKGAEKLAFDPIIAFGKNSAMPHYRAGNVRLKKGDIVLVDIGVVVDDYRSDMTRTFFFGPPDPLLKKWAQIVRDAQKEALKICRPGTPISLLDKAARSILKKEKVEEYFIHNLGHGVGLEIHEWPSLKATGEDKDLLLAPGMAITIEPGLYLPGKGGIRYEDTILITPTGHLNLYPK